MLRTNVFAPHVPVYKAVPLLPAGEDASAVTAATPERISAVR